MEEVSRLAKGLGHLTHWKNSILFSFFTSLTAVKYQRRYYFHLYLESSCSQPRETAVTPQKAFFQKVLMTQFSTTLLFLLEIMKVVCFKEVFPSLQKS